MFSSVRRGQVEPLPALLALAAFAIGLSLYGTTLESVSLGQEPDVNDATVSRTMAILTEGTVVVPDRLEELDGQLPRGTTVVVHAEGRSWRSGPAPSPEDPFVVRNVLVRLPDGPVPGVVRVST